MNGIAILAPVVALAAWTLVIWGVMYARRIPAMRRAGIDARTKVGGTGADLDRVLPERVQWAAHNYNHLHEAPTTFYAVAVSLALLGRGDGPALVLGWTYVALRIAHSLVHITGNRVVLRFSLFALSTLALGALVVLAAAGLLGG
ncbi:MAPEG family protein [Novosphingobium piscinae]|uniref:MAPEG family protein n=1 Tax=Novosphingobium piscinae TaxID=1507448 RepID=A0A7X1FW88_9SPHN|nr:MAPEG family protein [Novosphingobium piscinae]MBC2668086.1 MAPEG family protein [Novosphingobium piscinae]